jgi:hypothetical protein
VGHQAAVTEQHRRRYASGQTTGSSARGSACQDRPAAMMQLVPSGCVLTMVQLPVESFELSGRLFLEG